MPFVCGWCIVRLLPWDKVVCGYALRLCSSSYHGWTMRTLAPKSRTQGQEHTSLRTCTGATHGYCGVNTQVPASWLKLRYSPSTHGLAGGTHNIKGMLLRSILCPLRAGLRSSYLVIPILIPSPLRARAKQYSVGGVVLAFRVSHAWMCVVIPESVVHSNVFIVFAGVLRPHIILFN